MWKSVLAIPFLFVLAACSSDSGGGGGGDSTSYSISGTLDTSGTAGASGLAASANKEVIRELEDISIGLRARTACDDGQYYSVYCMTFTTPPVAAEGDVSCSGTSGSFTVSGLPLGEPIFCVVRRYADDTTTQGTNVGAIEIPTATLSGTSDTIVGNGNLQMAVTMGSDGTITAQVTGNTGESTNTAADDFFTPTNANGTWRLACNNNNGGSSFSAGACKCFLGESFYGEGGYSDQDACLADNGAGITSSVFLDIDMFIHPVSTTTDIQKGDGVTIPSGTDMKAISIWASGAKTGGEGVTTLGGALNWDATVEDPTTAITWTTGNVNVLDGTNNTVTINVPALPGNPNTMDHEQWVTWLQSVAAAAEAGNFDCTWGPSSNAVDNDTNLDQSVECINQVMEALNNESIGATLPRVWVQAYCDQNGCDLTDDEVDDADSSIYNPNTFQHVRLEFEDWELDYPNSWADSDNYNEGQAQDADPSTDGIGVSPQSRFVFEPLIIHPNGAGFRQGHHDQRHYHCDSEGGEVTHPDCTGNYWDLVCYSTEQLAIKFIGTSSPMDVIFDQTQSVVAGRLIEYTTNGPVERTPSTGNVISMCETAAGGEGFTFFASGTKQ